MKAIACLGNYAKVPYYFEKLDIRVFCMEELCHCLKENAFLLGNEVMQDSLLKFISQECDVPKLAGELYPLVHKKGNLSTFVAMILEYVGFYTPEEIRQIENTLKQGAKLPDYEKKKIQIDFMVEKKKYTAALEAYEKLCREMPKDGRKGPILHNMGVVYARMMMYRKAADVFLEAYRASGSNESFIAYLGAKRFVLTDREYVDFVAELKEQYANEMEFEKILERVSDAWADSPEYLGVVNLKEWRQEGRIGKYEEECEQILENLKNEYRESVQV